VERRREEKRGEGREDKWGTKPLQTRPRSISSSSAARGNDDDVFAEWLFLLARLLMEGLRRD